MTSPTTRSRSRSSDGSPDGVTLLELVVVIAIIATLLGLGLGAFRKMDSADRQAIGQVKDAFREARLFARARSAPATVVIDAEAGAVYATGLRAVGNWHFEDHDGVGWPVPAVLDRVNLVPGVLGFGVELVDEAQISLVDPPPSFDSPYGFGLDLFVAPADDPRPMTILERVGSWAVGLDAHGDLEIMLTLRRPPEPGSDVTSEEFRMSVPGVSLPSDRLTPLMVAFDGRRLTVAVDGRRAVEDTLFEEVRQLVVPAGLAVTTGVPPTHFRGRLDELRLSSVVVADHEPLPYDVTLSGPSRQVHIDAVGHLDATRHAGPEIVHMTWGVDPPLELYVELGLLGTVRSWSERPTERAP